MLGWIKGVFRLLFVDPFTYIIGDLRQQPWIMWAFIGWGWLSVLAMVASAATTVGDTPLVTEQLPQLYHYLVTELFGADQA